MGRGENTLERNGARPELMEGGRERRWSTLERAGERWEQCMEGGS